LLENENKMINMLGALKDSLDIKEQVKLTSTLSIKYSANQLKDAGYDITSRQLSYASTPEVVERTASGVEVSGGGRPLLISEDIEQKCYEYLLIRSTPSKKNMRRCFFFFIIITIF
jgi:hypothetical protein